MLRLLLDLLPAGCGITAVGFVLGGHPSTARAITACVFLLISLGCTRTLLVRSEREVHDATGDGPVDEAQESPPAVPDTTTD